MTPEKEYIGDGMYAEVKDDCLVLTTSNGIEDTNTIYVDISMVPALQRYIVKYKELFV